MSKVFYEVRAFDTWTPGEKHIGFYRLESNAKEKVKQLVQSGWVSIRVIKATFDD